MLMLQLLPQQSLQSAHRRLHREFPLLVLPELRPEAVQDCLTWPMGTDQEHPRCTHRIVHLQRLFMSGHPAHLFAWSRQNGRWVAGRLLSRSFAFL